MPNDKDRKCIPSLMKKLGAAHFYWGTGMGLLGGITMGRTSREMALVGLVVSILLIVVGMVQRQRLRKLNPDLEFDGFLSIPDEQPGKTVKNDNNPNKTK